MTKGEVLAWLRRRGKRRNVLGMARYGIVAKKVFGVSVSTLRALQKQIGKDHPLALALWNSGWFEARLLAALIDDPDLVTTAQMDAWAHDFENWADCDSTCFHLFDRTPLAWGRVRNWARSPREFVKRGAFALLASLALHDKTTPDSRFRPFLPVIARGAQDDRNFVKKGVSWALRGIGRRSLALNRASLVVAERLASSKESAPRWVGKDAFRELSSATLRVAPARRAKKG